MRLPINPWWFLGRLLVFFFLTFLAWKPVAPYYAQLLLHISWLTEIYPSIFRAKFFSLINIPQLDKTGNVHS